MFKEKVIMDCQATPIICLMSVVVLIALWFPFLIKAINFKTDLKLGIAICNNEIASRWSVKFMHILFHLVARQRQGERSTVLCHCETSGNKATGKHS